MTFLVVGGPGSTLGARVVDRLVGGASVVVGTRREPSEAEAPPGCVHVALDVRSDDAVAEVFARIEADHGPVRGLVYNAAVGDVSLVALSSSARWRALLEVNTLGALRVCRAAARSMQRHGVGSIVNVVSRQVVRPAPGHGAYAASKSALVALTRSLAVELAPRGIRVNAVAPGYFPSNLNDFAEAGPHVRGLLPGDTVVDDAADLIAALCRGMRSVSGQVFDVHSCV